MEADTEFDTDVKNIPNNIGLNNSLYDQLDVMADDCNKKLTQTTARTIDDDEDAEDVDDEPYLEKILLDENAEDRQEMINLSKIVDESYLITSNNCSLAKENLNRTYSVSSNAKDPTLPFNDKSQYSSEKVDSDDECLNSSPPVKRKRKRILVYDSDDEVSSQEATTAKTSKQANQVQTIGLCSKTKNYGFSNAAASKNPKKNDVLKENIIESFDDEDDSDFDDLNNLNPIGKKKNKSYECTDQNADKNADQNADKNNIKTDFFKSLYVPESSEGGKHYKKEACCPYCFKVVMRLDVHLLKMHKDKESVKKLQALPPQSSERKLIYKELRAHGNAKYNSDPLINNNGKLLVKRRLAINRGMKKQDNDEEDTDSESEIESDEDDLINKMRKYDLRKDNLEKDNNEVNKRPVKRLERIQCNMCPEYISRRNISSHFKKWHATDAEKHSNTRAILKTCRQENEVVHPQACERVKKEIIGSLRITDTFDLIRFDELIILYLNHICERYDIKDQNKLIRTNARTLGDYLKTMQTLDPSIIDLKSCMSSHQWGNTVAAVRKIAKFDDQTRLFGSPSTAQLLGLILKTVVVVLKSYNNCRHDRDGYRLVRSFEVEFEAHWTNSIGSKIVSSQNIIKRHDLGKTIPAMSTADKNILVEFLDTRRQVLFTQVQKKFSASLYVELMKCEMIYIQTANARRPCEIDRATIQDFNSKKHANPDGEQSKKLTSEERQRLQNYVYMETKGKKLHGLDGRIYLKPLDLKILNFLIHNRHKTCISKENAYLFANGEEHLDAHLTMKNLADLCHLKFKPFSNRVSITATGVRKYAATKYKSNTNGSHSTFLMRHLAHSQKTHDAHYRAITPQETAVVTNILECIILSTEDGHNNENDKETSFTAEDNDSSYEISQENTSNMTENQNKRKSAWKSQEIEDFEVAFAEELNKKEYPTRQKIRSAMEQFSLLKSRGEAKITSRFQYLKRKWNASH